MRIVVAAIGKARAVPEQALFDAYARRLARSGPAGLTLELVEAEERRKLAGDALRKAEAELLLARLPKDAMLVALDARGKPLASEAFANHLTRWRDEGVSDLAFVIGGADGLDPALLKRARFVLSLGVMTWPHLLVRAMLAEQIYRAQTILLGHPYHRGG
jgi:23S rRNA (pseudouridine1915-N3)-methyltransferase